MPKYLITYHGGSGMPESEAARQQMLQAFMAWAQSVGPSMVDPGAPLTAMKTVSSGSVTDGPAQGPANGYTVVEASDLAAAVKLVERHPFIGRGGSLQVSEAADLGG